MRSSLVKVSLVVVALASWPRAAMQDEAPPPVQPQGAPRGGRPPGGPGGPSGGEVALVKRFDANLDRRLDAQERQEARAWLQEQRSADGPRGDAGRPMGPGFGRRRNTEPPTPGAKVKPGEVAQFKAAELYDPTVLRTLFLDFASPDWEAELADFKNTDVAVPARLVVDGMTIEGVGVQFRGASSFMMVGAGSKRSLGVAVDFTEPKARLYGYTTLNLLNASGDPSFLRSLVYSTIARRHMPAPKVNFVKVVINGESWGVYTNAQQFNKEMLAEWYPEPSGPRWKVPGSPRGGGGLRYRGDDAKAYEREYEPKNSDPAVVARGWQALIRLCKTLEQTPPEQLERELTPLLAVAETLWYLALENALANSDGYWTRASDFSLFLDKQGVMHVIPHDMNECLLAQGGPGRGPGPGGPPDRPEREPRRGGAHGGGTALEPLAGADDPNKPLLSKLLAVPAWREQYLRNIRTIAEHDLAPSHIDPLLASCRALLEEEVRQDTRKLESFAAFERSFDTAADGADTADSADRRGAGPGLAQFIRARRAFLLAHPQISGLGPEPPIVR